MVRLKGKVALITGAARGMGATEARLFAQEGAQVVLGDIREAEGTQVAAEIRQAGGDSLFVPLDVTNKADWDRAMQATVDTFGGLNVLVNNAGIGERLPLDQVSRQHWDQTMDVNVTGVYLGIQSVVSVMKRGRGGSIINISSIAGLVGGASSVAYYASKGAVRLLTKAAALRYAKDGIRVNSIHPGDILTPMNAPFLADPARKAERVALVPLGRIGEPEDVAYGALYLASDESSFVTGSELVIDGGRTAQ